MPALYTHNSFGNEVYKHLSDDLKNIIKKYPGAFRAGLQGPDFLFFYAPLIRCKTNRLGHSQHHEPFIQFLNKIRPVLKKKGKDCGEYAYVLGFICHFMLDSESHTYVNQKVSQPGFYHLVMEIEFDRYRMKQDGKNPLTYPVWKHIHWDDKTLDAIYGIYRSFSVSKKRIKKSLQSMACLKYLFTTGKTLRRLVIRFFMLLTFHYRELEGHMMSLIPKRSSVETNSRLNQIYQDTILPCCQLMEKFDAVVLTKQPLPERFRTTFSSVELP